MEAASAASGKMMPSAGREGHLMPTVDDDDISIIPDVGETRLKVNTKTFNSDGTKPTERMSPTFHRLSAVQCSARASAGSSSVAESEFITDDFIDRAIKFQEKMGGGNADVSSRFAEKIDVRHEHGRLGRKPPGAERQPEKSREEAFGETIFIPGRYRGAAQPPRYHRTQEGPGRWFFRRIILRGRSWKCRS